MLTNFRILKNNKILNYIKSCANFLGALSRYMFKLFKLSLNLPANPVYFCPVFSHEYTTL